MVPSRWLVMPLRFRPLPLFLVLLLASAPRIPSVAQEHSATSSVIELFTSQGCSVCPPADALLKSYSERSDVVALSLPVDYWDYLGWTDTFASPKFTGRQRAYAKARGDGEIYTPQVVVNGVAHVVGTKRGDIDRAIERTSKAFAAARVPLRVWSDKETVTIEAGAAADPTTSFAGTVWLAVVQPRADVEVRHGENRGRKLAYYNVVRELTAVGMWSGQPTRIQLQNAAIVRSSNERCAVFLQQGATGPIIGAAWMTVGR
jgi:hypothetical protein